MIIEIHSKGGVKRYDLDMLVAHYTAINIGRMTDEVWNTIAIEDESIDPFQCHLIGCAGGPWRLHHGQNRTDCPKGLKSDKLVPCNGCEGPCIGGRPKYINREPKVLTLIDGKPVASFGTELLDGSKVSMGDVVVLAIE